MLPRVSAPSPERCNYSRVVPAEPPERLRGAPGSGHGVVGVNGVGRGLLLGTQRQAAAASFAQTFRFLSAEPNRFPTLLLAVQGS